MENLLDSFSFRVRIENTSDTEIRIQQEREIIRIFGNLLITDWLFIPRTHENRGYFIPNGNGILYKLREDDCYEEIEDFSLNDISVIRICDHLEDSFCFKTESDMVLAKLLS